MRTAALLWLVLVLAAAVYLGVRVAEGIQFQTDLTALLPQEERDPAVQQAKDRVTELLGRRIVLLVGHADRAAARDAGAALAEGLRRSGLVASVDYELRGDSLRRMGATFFPYRSGLLSTADRERLQAGRGNEIVARALATVFGPIGVADGRLLQQDPFFLLPNYLAELPRPLPRLTPDDGILSVRDGGKTYVLVTAQLNGAPFALTFQNQFIASFDEIERRVRQQSPGVDILRLGVVFYAQAGSAAATRETSVISTVSLIGTIVLVLVVFRALRPLWMTLLAIGVGVVCAFAAGLWLFGALHVVALLFGTSLVGIALDYCLQYLSARFNPELGTPMGRLRRVLPGISIGIATTLIGYVTLMFAPFPGLHQVAVFSAVGLSASFATVVLWLPRLDGAAPFGHGAKLLAAAAGLWSFWEERRFRRWRAAAAGTILVLALLGASQLVVDDDVRHLQALSGSLRHQEAELRRLAGIAGGTEFLLVHGADEEGALEAEERLLGGLVHAAGDGAIAGFQAIAQYIPSAARQRENRALVQERLTGPFLPAYDQQLGIPDRTPSDEEEPGFLTLAAIDAGSPLSFLRDFDIEQGAGGVMHVVPLTGVAREGEVRRISEEVPGVRLIDPAGDTTRLLRAYRRRAVLLLAVSTVLMLPVVFWRYGLRGGMRVLVPPAVAVLLTPLLLALAGIAFNFFAAMALVLVLSVGFDYAVFCRETDTGHRLVTMLGVWLALVTTILSFGLLAASSVAAVRGFGMTLLVGTLVAFLVSPLAGGSTPNQSRLRRGIGR